MERCMTALLQSATSTWTWWLHSFLKFGCPEGRRSQCWNYETVYSGNCACRFVWTCSLSCFVFFFLEGNAIHHRHHYPFLMKVLGFPIIAILDRLAKQQEWDDFANCNIIPSMILSQPVTHTLTEITFNYGNIIPDSRHRMASVKIILFVVRWSKSGLKEKA
jgi:hypothetical protein